MQGDFSRDTFDRFRHFSRVLQQQGRVRLDADTNEQTSILLHLIRSLAADVFWPGGGRGFEIKPKGSGNTVSDLEIGSGRYFVDGIMCENEIASECPAEGTASTYLNQPERLADEEVKWPTTKFLVYLDVWERHVTWIEAPLIREVALGGPDTATRARVVWKVRLYAPENAADLPDMNDWRSFSKKWEWWTTFLAQRRPNNRGCLRAQLAAQPADATDPCPVSPRSRYRGAENQLYRVEIHRGGIVKRDNPTPPNFKWSRNNGSLIYPIRQVETQAGGATVFLDSLGRDDREMLEVGDWVEILDDKVIRRDKVWNLFRVVAVGRDDSTVQLYGADVPTIPNDDTHPYLRLWDQREVKPGSALSPEGTIPVTETGPIPLENGIEISFSQSNATYQQDDYWLIPARTATGRIEWPAPGGNSLFQPPRGIDHHYAPLAVVNPANLTSPTDLRKTFDS